MVDGFLLMAIIMPVAFGTGYYERVQTQQVGLGEQIAMSLLGMVVMLALNGYLLFARGQSIGKMLTKIQIVDARNGQLLPFLRVYVYRYLWMLPISVVVTLIPGTIDDIILINVVSLVDMAMIFGAPRRCLHDYIAGSKVVIYQANRQTVS